MMCRAATTTFHAAIIGMFVMISSSVFASETPGVVDASESGVAPQTTGHSEDGERKAIIAQFNLDYGKAGDKLGYLLSQADSEYNEILVEVALKLALYDDPRSIAVLRKLKEHHSRKESETSVAGAANMALQHIAAAPDMKKLKPGMPKAQMEALARKYVRDNDEGRSQIHTFMQRELEKKPRTYVPLLVEYYADTPSTRELARKYPELSNKGLEKCLEGSISNNVGNCISLIDALKLTKFLQKMHDVVFEKKGNVDYLDVTGMSFLRHKAISAYFHFKAAGLPFLESVLYKEDYDYRRAAVNLIGAIESKDGTDILRRFRDRYAKEPDANADLLKRVDVLVPLMEERDES